MKDNNVINNKFIHNGLVISEKLLIEVERLRIDRITDANLLRFLDFFILEIEKISTTIDKNPRFDWVEIQEEIDRSYAIDPNLTGAIIYFDWKSGENKIHINYKVNKPS